MPTCTTIPVKNPSINQPATLDAGYNGDVVAWNLSNAITNNNKAMLPMNPATTDDIRSGFFTRPLAAGLTTPQ